MSIKNSDYSKYKNATQKELDKAFLHSCIYTKFDHIKYLLTSPELKRHANVHTNEDLGFAHLMGNKEKARDIITYLIFDFNIEKTSTIEEILEYEMDSLELINLTKDIKRMFEQRELNQELDSILVKNDKHFKKIKI
jgi:flagellin-specific chaperone FliS